jgi:hypothetical protein
VKKRHTFKVVRPHMQQQRPRPLLERHGSSDFAAVPPCSANGDAQAPHDLPSLLQEYATSNKPSAKSVLRVVLSKHKYTTVHQYFTAWLNVPPPSHRASKFTFPHRPWKKDAV